MNKKSRKILDVTARRTDCDRYQITGYTSNAYVYDDYLIPDFPQTMSDTHVVNERREPSLNGAVLASLAIGDRVKVSGQENGW